MRRSSATCQKRAAIYVDKILKGAAPGDLPVEQPTHFQLVFNLKTAKTLSLTIPRPLLLRADHVMDRGWHSMAEPARTRTTVSSRRPSAAADTDRWAATHRASEFRPGQVLVGGAQFPL